MSSPTYDWAALYTAHRDAMYRVVLDILRSSGRFDLADDAVMNAIESLMKKPPSEPPDSWEGLLVRTAQRRALDLVKSADIAKRADLPKDYEEGSSPSHEDAVLDRLDAVERMKPAIGKLGDQAHYVLAQYIVLERPRTEVAAELKVTPGRVSQISRKLLEDLRAAIQEGESP